MFFIWFIPTDAFSQISVSISGPSPVCEGKEEAYSASSRTTLTDYTWSTSGGTIVSGQYTSAIRVRWDKGTGVKRLTLNYGYDSFDTTNGETVPKTGSTYRDVAVNAFLPGSVSGSKAVCGGGASGSLSLGNYTGNILEWQMSTNNGSSWISISNTTNSYSYSNVNVTTMYRVKLNHTNCTSTYKYSTPATITIYPLPSAPPAPSIYGCGGTTTLTKPAVVEANVAYYWQGTNERGEDISTAAAADKYTTSTPGTYYLRARSSVGCWSTNSTAVTVSYVEPPSKPVLQSNGSRIGTGLATMIVSGAPSGGSYRLYSASSGGSL